MLDREKGIIIGYLLNLIAYGARRTGIVKEICQYLEKSDLLRKGAEKKFTGLMEALPTFENLPQRKLAALVKELITLLHNEKTALLKDNQSSLLEKNIHLISEHLELSPLDGAILSLILRHNDYMGFHHCFNDITREYLSINEAFAAALRVDQNLLNEHLRLKGQLLTCGIIRARSGRDLDDLYVVRGSVRSALNRSPGGIEVLLELILGEPSLPSLQWNDFDHLAPMRDKLNTFLKESFRQKESGINILLWGEPGTGKTELCKTLAAKLGVKLYAIGEYDEVGGEPNRHERMESYQLCQSLLRMRNDTLLMFDEMDDIFEEQSLTLLHSGKAAVGSKVFVNRILETNPLPTVWVINNIAMLDEAFIRRMSLVIEVKSPPVRTREQIWTRLLDKHGVRLPEAELRSLTALNIPPAIVDNAARFARKTGGGADDFRFAAQGIIHAMRGGRPLPPEEKTEIFCPELTNAEIDLGRLSDRLVTSGTKSFSLCIYGPPGTGKSAYLRYLAEQLGMPVLLKRASDLLDKYVGGSEKQIAGAFTEALDKEAFLIFDEADSLLSDRRQAVRSWEVTQVNEMLTWMERHPLPFACTTNLHERLDPASLRRFTFKCCFDYMTETQVKDAFQHFFGMSLPTAANLTRLTAGDFAVVRRKAEILRIREDIDELFDLLHQEMGCKGGEPKRAIGFCGR